MVINILSSFIHYNLVSSHPLQRSSCMCGFLSAEVFLWTSFLQLLPLLPRASTTLHSSFPWPAFLIYAYHLISNSNGVFFLIIATKTNPQVSRHLFNWSVLMIHWSRVRHALICMRLFTGKVTSSHCFYERPISFTVTPRWLLRSYQHTVLLLHFYKCDTGH